MYNGFATRAAVDEESHSGYLWVDMYEMVTLLTESPLIHQPLPSDIGVCYLCADFRTSVWTYSEGIVMALFFIHFNTIW
jgi:hypothetical protein